MTPQQSVEKKIRKACPELQELKFGCEVIDLRTGFKRTVLEKKDLGVFIWSHEDGNGVGVYQDKVKIIGNPIQLQHVLRAIKAGKKVSAAINENGRISLSEPVKYTAGEVIPNTYPVHWVGCSYDLTRPSSEQSEEVYRFLDEILK